MLMFIMMLGLTVSGCISFGTTSDGNPIDRAVLARIVKGKTTRAEVLEMLGAPKIVENAKVTNLAEQALAQYEGEELTLKLDPALFNDVYIYEKKETEYFILFLVVFNYYSSTERSDRLAVFFDQQGKVLGVGWSSAEEGS
ncbi:MAG: hypothetical protein ACYTFG_06710 [Planctomycetota bacterium]